MKNEGSSILSMSNSVSRSMIVIVQLDVVQFLHHIARNEYFSFKLQTSSMAIVLDISFERGIVNECRIVESKRTNIEYQICKAPIRSRRRESDIRRVLYSRGQEDRFDVDELYAAFSALEPQRVADLRRELAERSWHFMGREDRYDFLTELLPEFEEWFDLLTDFRAGGYRILGDLVCDIDDENNATERKRLHREADSPAFSAMMDGYENKPYSQSYREAVAEVCRKPRTRSRRTSASPGVTRAWFSPV